MQHWMSVATALLRPSGRIGSEWINATYAAQKRWALFADKERAAVLNALLPDGVAGLITPWNFPNAMLARKMAPAWRQAVPSSPSLPNVRIRTSDLCLQRAVLLPDGKLVFGLGDA
ncbi:hypothetical protein CLH62_08895 [Marinobacter guineae]|uniref:Uncharacterized protein n=1 Tax=Marinobacter guineae TaxID=432303 RepID=A0A2G1VG02_9GAMM|nr:hypothetical protein CLH62_08895 [Marinobacter guineae]